MKIRHDFVTNSSSSSYIVAFPDVPEDALDVCRMMFGNKTDHEGYSTLDLAKHVLKDIQSDGPAEYDNLVEELEGCGSEYGAPNYDDYRVLGIKYEFRSDDYHRDIENWARRELTEFLKKYNESILYIFEYDDDNDFGYMMERSGIFNKLPHYYINKH